MIVREPGVNCVVGSTADTLGVTMTLRAGALRSRLDMLQSTTEALRAHSSGAERALDRLRIDLRTVMFHLDRNDDSPPLLAIIGGTGTGKSTLVNRLLDADLSATSFRRTFTAGAVAITADRRHLPAGWLDLSHSALDAAQLPARGEPDSLAVVTHAHRLLEHLALIDTPDLDGDQPAHHMQADRVFRWADAVLFLVTPEKYQMTELLPYYRLARRYQVPAVFVMNKVEEQAVVDDYARQCGGRVFAIPRDDSTYQPPAEGGLDGLRGAVGALRHATPEDRARGIANRTSDLLDRLRDQVIAPLRDARREVDKALAALRALETPAPGVDVNPLTQALQRRLQQRSVLYLMGPGRMLDRVRQVPGMIARLPRTTWDWLRTGQIPPAGNGAEPPPDLDRGKLDFRTALVDQFNVVQSRIDDIVGGSRLGAEWMAQPEYASTRLDPDRSGAIADEELASLQEWLQTRWNATPRDTAVLNKLMKYLPGGKKLTQWSEAAPYLLAIAVATHHAFFGPIDLLVIGGFSLATWLGERLSNEVASRARAANYAIASRFTRLAHEQIRATSQWLQSQAPDTRALDALVRLADDISQMIEPAIAGGNQG